MSNFIYFHVTEKMELFCRTYCCVLFYQRTYLLTINISSNEDNVLKFCYGKIYHSISCVSYCCTVIEKNPKKTWQTYDFLDYLLIDNLIYNRPPACIVATKETSCRNESSWLVVSDKLRKIPTNQRSIPHK